MGRYANLKILQRFLLLLDLYRQLQAGSNIIHNIINSFIARTPFGVDYKVLTNMHVCMTLACIDAALQP